ncbi:hypothetical protein B5S37_22630 [Ralstonia solanacearum]|nr:hypothetical protein B5S37_22630 [Ralstonia solanacearum]
MCKRRLGIARDILVTRRPIHDSRAMRALALTATTHHSNHPGPGFATEPGFPCIQAVGGAKRFCCGVLMSMRGRVDYQSKNARRIISRAGNRF